VRQADRAKEERLRRKRRKALLKEAEAADAESA